MNIKVFNLLSKVNETRYVSWQETCACKRKQDASVCDDRPCWNNDKCRCECKELMGKGRCGHGFIWNPSVCEFECDKS